MTDERVWTAAELEQLTPDERDRIAKEGMVTDLSELPLTFSLEHEPTVARFWSSAKS